MELPEQRMHSFVVRIWLEEGYGETAVANWRGVVTHVLSNRMVHVTSLIEIDRFIAGYLRQMGVADESDRS